MNAEQLKAIRDRKTLSSKYISLTKLLNINDMGIYLRICCDRIAGAELIDGKHIVLEFFDNVDILLDYIGLIKCEDILQGYISFEKLEAYEEYIKLENSVIDLQNTQIETLRKMDISCINNLLNKPLYYFGDNEIAENMKVLLQAELKARKIENKARVIVVEIIHKALFYFRNYKMINYTRNFLKNYE